MKKIYILLIAIFAINYSNAQTPTITSFSPDTGSVGSLITIIGTNLSNPTLFNVGGTSAIIVSNTDSTLVGMIMPNTQTGLISITTSNGATLSNNNFNITPTYFPLLQSSNKLTSTDTAGYLIEQGHSVSISSDGTTAIVGGILDDSRKGAAWVYVRIGGVWVQQGNKLVGTGAVNGIYNAEQGKSVALSADGNTAIVGGARDDNGKGAAWVYVRTGGVWVQQGNKLVGTNAINGTTNGASQGFSVALSADGNTAIIGGPFDNSSKGAVWIFTRSGGIWTQQGNKIVGTGAIGNAYQGWSVSLCADGNTAIVGGLYDNSEIGAAWVFTRNSGVWTQQGNKLVGTGYSYPSNQGCSVSISSDGNTIIIGGPTDNPVLYSGCFTGASWIFIRNGGIWSQQGSKLIGTGSITSTQFSYKGTEQGNSVSLNADGSCAVIGGPNDNDSKGATWVFARNNGVWTQRGLKIIGPGAIGNAYQGTTVSISADGNSAIIGGFFDNNQVGASWIIPTFIYPDIPTIVASKNNICIGGTTTLRIATGNLNCATSWKWYSGNCGGTYLGSGDSISVSPTSTTTYYVKAVGDCILTGNCSTITIIVNNNTIPLSPATITGAMQVCQGQNSLLYTVPQVANATSYLWSLPYGAAGTSTTNSINVNYGTSAISGNIVVKGVNACGIGDSSILSVIINSLPTNVTTIIGPVAVCKGQNAVLYSVPVIPNATSYSWTLSNNISGFSNNNSISVNFINNSNSGIISVKGINSCGYGGSYTLWINIADTLSNTGSISGTSAICHSINNYEYLYSIPSINYASTYSWSLPSGATGTSTTNSIIVIYPVGSISGNISVVGVNACGNSSASTKPITIYPLPSAAGTIIGPTSVCQNNSYWYKTSPILNADYYEWTKPDGSTITSFCDSILIGFNSQPSGYIKVRGKNNCNYGSYSNNFAVIVNKLPLDPTSAISGPLIVCQGQTSVIYSIPTITYSTSYIWTLPNGATGTSTTNTISVNYNTTASSGFIIVSGNNSCGVSSNNASYVTVNQLPIAAGIIMGLTSVCSGQASVTYTLPAITNATSYIWSLPAGANGSSTSNTITVNYGTSAISGNLSVYGANSCGNGASSTLSISVNSLPNAASAISGLTTVCQGQSTVTYSLPAIPNATSYIWTLPTGATGSSTTNTITVNYGTSAVSGNLSVYGASSCGNGASSTLSISVNSLPDAASAISGATTVCQGQSTVTYSLPAIPNATSYIWTLPTGATGSSTTNTITVNYGSTAISGNITVKGNNSCGNGAISSLAITVNPLPATATSIIGSSNVTAGQQNVQYSIPTIANATSYIWTLPNGATGTSTTNSIIVNYSSSAVSGNITVKGTNSCGDGSIASLYVTVNPYSSNCSAQFTLVADTAVLHHYFVVNNASGVAPLHYNWSWGDGNHDTIAYPAHTYSAAGYYKICLTIIDSVGCTTTYCDSSYLQKDPNAIISVQVIPQGTLGINSLSSDKIKIYPNPAKDNLIIELSESKDLQNNTITIYNIAGQLIKQLSTKQAKTEIDIHSFAAGVYIVKVNNDKETLQGKFVKY